MMAFVKKKYCMLFAIYCYNIEFGGVGLSLVVQCHKILCTCEMRIMICQLKCHLVRNCFDIIVIVTGELQNRIE